MNVRAKSGPERTRQKMPRLVAALRGRKTLGIVMQDSPDPDAIAAAMALRELANAIGGTSCTFIHGSVVTRSENRELIRYLGIRLHGPAEVDWDRFDGLALVDTQPGAGNNCLPAGRVPLIVFDHHPLRRLSRRAMFSDIRRRYGATSTLLCEYLREARIPIDVPLATALLYGIRSDTQDLGRESTQADIDAVLGLYPVANKRMLGTIANGPVPRHYYRILARSLESCRVYGRAALCSLGETDYPDTVAEVADVLIRAEDIDWALCYGVHRERLVFSIRCTEAGADAGRVAHRLVARLGTGGGHTMMAGGQIPLPAATRARRTRVEGILNRRFLQLTRQTGNPETRLLD